MNCLCLVVLIGFCFFLCILGGCEVWGFRVGRWARPILAIYNVFCIGMHWISQEA